MISGDRMTTEEQKALLDELAGARDDLAEAEKTITALRRDLRRKDVQLASLKTENEEFKTKFASIENNPLGKIAFSVYRRVREYRRR